MQINILSVGKNMPSWAETSFKEYAKRLSSNWPVKLIEISPQKRGTNQSVDKLKSKEADEILNKLPKQGVVVALDEHGKELTTLKLAKKLTEWQLITNSISFIIGGADGLDAELIKHADFVWSLSQLTLPHMLVRVVLAEQLYRAWTVTIGHPYHRE